jgi:hypothetical protein
MDQDLLDTLRHYVLDAGASWSCGTFGAIAEFTRDPDEDFAISEDGLAITTARGGMRLTPITELRPIAYELVGRRPETWEHGLALCLPKDRSWLAARVGLTELGPDATALRPADREAILFDLGLAIEHVDICVRTADPETIGLLRNGLGRSLLSPENARLLGEIARLSPHRVFRCRFGRVEVYQPIPDPGTRTPPGPHTHVLPRFLALRRTHAATLPIPPGWVPCMTLFPPNPISDGYGGVRPFDNVQHEAFQRLLARYGIPELVALKTEMFTACAAGQTPRSPDVGPPFDRAGRAVMRVALRQWRQLQTHTDVEPARSCGLSGEERTPPGRTSGPTSGENKGQP